MSICKQTPDSAIECNRRTRLGWAKLRVWIDPIFAEPFAYCEGGWEVREKKKQDEVV